MTSTLLSAIHKQTNFEISQIRGIALAMMLVSWPTSQWISATRAQITVNMRRIARVTLCNALHKLLVVVPSTALQSSDSHRGLQKLASRDLANLAIHKTGLREVPVLPNHRGLSA